MPQPTRRTSIVSWTTLLLCAAMLPACKGSLSVLGNATSMLITIVLLWSTLHINRT